MDPGGALLIGGINTGGVFLIGGMDAGGVVLGCGSGSIRRLKSLCMPFSGSEA